MEGTAGKVIAGIIKDSIHKKTSENLAKLGAGEGRSSVPYAALARLSVRDDEKTKESRGVCGICGKEVLVDQDRMKYTGESRSIYFHMKCVDSLCEQHARIRR
jgi:hypothetical protein